MGGPQVPQPTLSPEQLRLREQANTDRIESIRDRVGDETRDLLVRFGRRQAFAGTSGSGTSSSTTPGALGLFSNRRLDVLRGLRL